MMLKKMMKKVTMIKNDNHGGVEDDGDEDGDDDGDGYCC